MGSGSVICGCSGGGPGPEAVAVGSAGEELGQAVGGQWGSARRLPAGYDHDNTHGLSTRDRLGAIVANWPIARADADHVVDHGLPLVGTVKGVIPGDLVYWPTAVVPLMGGLGFTVDPDRRGHDQIGTGAIVEIPRGPICKLVIPTR
ncbi:hypothetical protein ACIGO9_31605 [Nocardia asteroides]|uniref:hypothetical protein n=1 Tax=Nocardia asteroides TaxID=1824 RepID=UPI0037C73CA0